MIAETTRERRRNSKKAEIVVAPRPGFRLPKPIRRLQRNAPMYAIQGISELNARLRGFAGRDVIDLNRVMEVVQFIYQQRELARRGPNYAVDDFGFDREWTESFLTAFKALYRDYWRVETTGVEHLVAGIAWSNPDDDGRLARGAAVFDGLHGYFRKRKA